MVTLTAFLLFVVSWLTACVTLLIAAANRAILPDIAITAVGGLSLGYAAAASLILLLVASVETSI